MRIKEQPECSSNQNFSRYLGIKDIKIKGRDQMSFVWLESPRKFSFSIVQWKKSFKHLLKGGKVGSGYPDYYGTL